MLNLFQHFNIPKQVRDAFSNLNNMVMKKIILIALCFIGISIKAQSVKTVTLAVKGNCEQCKERIENAADIKGVKVCTWDELKKVATITYNSNKVSIEQISAAIAKSGHEAGSSKPDPKAYQNLPGCC